MSLSIKSLREKADLTQTQLAAILGVNQKAVSQWESGTTWPDSRRLPELARALGCRIEDLYRKDDETA